MLKCVPFNHAWIQHTKLDLKAIYRRPRWKEDEYGEMQREFTPDGVPAWDVTGPLPVKSHNKYLAKGFEYITLADRASLSAAAKEGTIQGDWREYVQDPRTQGPWHYRKYVEGAADADKLALAKLRELVEKYGPDLVEEMKRETDPGFTLPAELRALKPAKKAKEVA